MATALVQVASGIARKLPLDVVRVERIQFDVVLELRRASELIIVLVNTHGTGARGRQSGQPKQRAAEFLHLGIYGVQVDRQAVLPRMIVGEIDPSAFV